MKWEVLQRTFISAGFPLEIVVLRGTFLKWEVLQRTFTSAGFPLENVDSVVVTLSPDRGWDTTLAMEPGSVCYFTAQPSYLIEKTQLKLAKNC